MTTHPITANKCCHVSYTWAHEYAKRAKHSRLQGNFKEADADIDQMRRARRNAQAWSRIARNGGAA